MESMRKIFLQLFNNTITTIFTKKNLQIFFIPKGIKKWKTLERHYVKTQKKALSGQSIFTIDIIGFYARSLPP